MDIQEVTGVALVFLNRVDLTGDESNAHVEVKNWVLSMQQGEIVPVAKNDLQHLIDRDAAFTALQEAEAAVESGNLEKESIKDTPDG